MFHLTLRAPGGTLQSDWKIRQNMIRFVVQTCAECVCVSGCVHLCLVDYEMELCTVTRRYLLLNR